MNKTATASNPVSDQAARNVASPTSDALRAADGRRSGAAAAARAAPGSDAMERGHSTPEHRRRITETIAHLAHILPGQAPLRDFVHHNTLHGDQHRHFPEALENARRRAGVACWLPEERFRAFYGKGRITDADLLAVLDGETALAADEILLRLGDRALRRRELYLAALIHPVEGATEAQLAWNIEEMGALTHLASDLGRTARRRLLGAEADRETRDSRTVARERKIVADLWQAALEALGLTDATLHPEELLDLSADQAEGIISDCIRRMEAGGTSAFRLREEMDREIDRLLDALLPDPGANSDPRPGPNLGQTQNPDQDQPSMHDGLPDPRRRQTLRGVLRALTGQDILDEIRPLLVRQMANHLDLGVAAWRHPERRRGFFAAWRVSARQDPAWILDGMPRWRDRLTGLPDDPLETVILELASRGVAEADAPGYLETLALELPGWSGMFAWRQAHPAYAGSVAQVTLTDYLAVRLVLERLFADRLCARLWGVEPDVERLRELFHANRPEFLTRYALFNTHLPEYAAQRAHGLVRLAENHPVDREEWAQTAHLIWVWRHSPAGAAGQQVSVRHDGWRLFLLAQRLGIDGAGLRAASREEIDGLLGSLERLTPERRGFIWLRAYENHYRDRIFQAVSDNHGRGRWRERGAPVPDAQIVFCMDDREEGIRRHLEERNPAIETLGAAGFFGVAMNWLGLDDAAPSALCPVVMTPTHLTREAVSPEAMADNELRDRRRRLRNRATHYLVNDSRADLVAAVVGVVLAAPAALLHLSLRLLQPRASARRVEKLLRRLEPAPATRLVLTADDDDAPPTPAHNRLGFTDAEQADRVAGFLQTIGLTRGFAPWVVLAGHGSTSENNPHAAAYDCGACSGRHGGPNARVFAAMANRPEVRALLEKREISIPKTTRFIGLQHNTGDESFTWYDLPDRPGTPDGLAKLQEALERAARESARERCHLFASAPPDPSPARALAHVEARGRDISQARPELGHATNAAAFIGRRAMSQGIFLDRRAFLISYDCAIDPQGLILENLLLSAGPVGAGINLEYYFSTVNNDRLGCGSKTTHNVAGFFGVMDGTASDLRTGLPLQMIEIHEAMRLQILVEATTEVLTAIYQRQPPLQELIGNGWLLLAAKDPDTPAIHLFDPAHGWTRWQGDGTDTPQAANSRQWRQGRRLAPAPPALIQQPGEASHG